jgi:hypothetical protein
MAYDHSPDHITFRFNITALITGAICLVIGWGAGSYFSSEGPSANAECKKTAIATRDRCMNSGLSGLRKNPETIAKCEEVYETDLERCGG